MPAFHPIANVATYIFSQIHPRFYERKRVPFSWIPVFSVFFFIFQLSPNQDF